MSAILSIARREFSAYFTTATGYVVLGMFAAISGMAFTLSLLGYAKMSLAPTAYGYTATPDFAESFLSPYLVFCGTLIMFLAPLITMRLVAEEKHRGTMELLHTWPLRDRDIIFGKYLAALGVVSLMLLIIAVHLILVGVMSPMEPAVLIFGMLTVFLMGAAFISLGLFISSITRNQITSGTITFGLSLLLYIVGNLSEQLPEGNPAPAAWPGILQQVVGRVYALFRGLSLELPVDAHAREMALGVVLPKDIGYYILFSAFFLFLTFRAFESRNWRA
ncbi:MAG: ABC transporter permease subunit [Candidatus Hydrogenedens sp.]|jgi:ABC-2 type transport system permease protein|nr:ABC transporter permease subunit [Candidatus Hydrogenedens sp.]